MKKRGNIRCAGLLIAGVVAALPAMGCWHTARAGSADVIVVETIPKAPEVYDFRITIKGMDTGWTAHADRVEAVGPDGTIYGTRFLERPTEAAQPFTTDMSNVWVPGVVNSVTFRVHFNETGFDGMGLDVRLGVR